VLCSYLGDVARPAPRDTYTAEMANTSFSVDDYYRRSSRGLISFGPSFATGWYGLDKMQSGYVKTANGTTYLDWPTVVRDCMKKAAASVNFPSYSTVNVRAEIRAVVLMETGRWLGSSRRSLTWRLRRRRRLGRSPPDRELGDHDEQDPAHDVQPSYRGCAAGAA
jgi:hypothetical protein